MTVTTPISTGRRVALLAGGVLAAALILWGGFGVYALLTPVTTTQHQVRLPVEQSRMTLDVSSGDVTLRRGTGSEVVVDRTVRYRTSEPRLVERSDAGGIRIEAECSGPFEWGCAVSYDITVPDGFDLDLAARSGSVDVRDLTVTRLRQDVSSGTVEMVGVTGPIEVRASSGSITAERLTSDDVYVEASSGEIDLAFAAVPRRVVADSSSGSIEIVVPGGPYAVDTDVSSGEERVEVPVDSTSDRSIRARASSGDIDVLRTDR